MTTPELHKLLDENLADLTRSTTMHIAYRVEQQMYTGDEVEQQMIIPKGKPFTRFINGDAEDFRAENMEWTSELHNSDAVNYDEQIQKVLIVASQVDDDKVRSGLLEIILWMTKGAPFKCTWYPEG